MLYVISSVRWSFSCCRRFFFSLFFLHPLDSLNLSFPLSCAAENTSRKKRESKKPAELKCLKWYFSVVSLHAPYCYSTSQIIAPFMRVSFWFRFAFSQLRSKCAEYIFACSRTHILFPTRTEGHRVRSVRHFGGGALCEFSLCCAAEQS